MFTLQDSNAKLVAALHEANSGAEQWKKQLAEYQEETERLRDQVRRRSRAFSECPDPSSTQWDLNGKVYKKEKKNVNYLV